jgi:hypothetical protein
LKSDDKICIGMVIHVCLLNIFLTYFRLLKTIKMVFTFNNLFFLFFHKKITSIFYLIHHIEVCTSINIVKYGQQIRLRYRTSLLYMYILINFYIFLMIMEYMKSSVQSNKICACVGVCGELLVKYHWSTFNLTWQD